ncbi:hypothetical protein CNMCM5793_003513 [Aspergillus hiratsukae]|uniref:NAD(P)-binding protein n=1 Tax=Aspergillus hiratsukae TaxID=1194566 RepID=A0A8H6PE84_9EURO|nr:hypothetical protein CNMCM5793_003513 [Aspergillus hiratsukae]KAF7169315.1 hypothetical protein CNMCM6106_004227 [Aspergillus hiratsukae]
MASNSKPVILLTGGNRGLGHETLKLLARSNKYQLVVAARSQSKADDAVKAIAPKTGNADLTPVVLDSDEAIFNAAKIVEEKLGHLDILVNNAGINRSPNPNATLREDFRARRIVTVTSGLGMFGVALTEGSPYNAWNYKVPVYRSSKSAVNMVSAVDMIALREENISTVLVEPGYRRTAFGAFQGHKDADEGGKVIARAAVEGDNKDLFLEIVDDEGKHAEFGW